MTQLLKFVTLALAVAPWACAFPAYRSLGGLSPEELDAILPGLHIAPPEGPPPPPTDNSTRLVYDEAHPYIAPGPNDQRGPCPGFNTLANHGVSVLPYFCIILINVGACSISIVMVLSLRLS